MPLPHPSERDLVDFPFSDLLRKGDRISFGQGCSEPVGLVRELMRQGADLSERIGRIKIFTGGTASGLIKPAHAAHFDIASYGALGELVALSKAGVLDVFAVAYSQVPALLTGPLRPDVVLLQLSAPDAAGRYSLGLANDYQLIAARQARTVVAEVNRCVPFLPNALLPDDIRIDCLVHHDSPPVEWPVPSPDAVSERIAAHAAGLIRDGATLQVGVGGLMDAICAALRSHRDMGIHTGILTDGLADLMARGVVTNTRKGAYQGISLAGSLLGSRKLIEFAHHNPGILLENTHITHGSEALARQLQFCSINSAIEVDLTGQVNAEVAFGHYVGAVGGQPDFVRAAAISPGGVSLIALPSSASSGKVSRIVASLSGPVTTPRCDVDYVVTEWGVAGLKGCALAQRQKRLIAIAHPDHREALSRASTAR